MELSDRKKRILKAIVETYIASAEPVGSKAIAVRPDLNLSSATIRNEMAELEEMGYLEKQHTSSGRIPSPSGYRLYVNELMNNYQLSMQEINNVKQALNMRVQELDHLISEAGRLISELTNHTAVAFSPSSENISVRRFDIVPIDLYSFVLILVTTAGIVLNKLVRIQSPVTEDEVVSLNQAINHSCSGIPITQISNERLKNLYNISHGTSSLMTENYDFFKRYLRRTKR